MNQAFNPVFAFKRLMGDENANNVILRFMCHPVLWEAISDEKIFLKLIDLFGSDIENWTPKNICKNAAEIRETNNLSVNQENNWDSFEKEDQLVDIYKSVTQIEGQKQDNKTWGEIFEELQLSEILENALVENDSSKLSLLSFLIHCSTDQDHIDDFLKTNINIFINYPEILKELIFKLDNFDEHKKAKLLVRKFLDHPDVLKTEIECEKSTLLQIDNLEEIRKITELRILSSFVHDEEKCQFYKDIAEKLFIQSSNINPVKLYAQDMEIDDKDLFSLENFMSIKKKHSDKANSLVTSNLKDIFDAFNLMNSNEGAAREICKRFVGHIHEEGIENIINSPEIGYLIDPIDIAKILIKLGLKDDAVLLLEEILNSHSGNKQITKFMAHYSRIFGDHKRAVKYYSILFAKNKILRGEKIQFFRSLQYLGMWQDAFIVHKTINKLNINDKLEYAISAFRAEKTAEFQNEIGEILSNSPNNRTAQSLKALFHQRKNEKMLSGTLIENVINTSNKDIRTIKFIEEYLRKNDDVEKQGEFLEGLPFKYQSHPEIALLKAKVKRSLGKTGDYINILRDLSSAKGEIKQVVAEEILYELIDNNMFEEAATFLQTYGEKWVLSPKIGQAKLKVFIEAREFIKAEIVLSSLLSREIINEEIIIDYGCLLLKTSLAEFPYSRTPNMLSSQEVNKFQDLSGSLNIKNPSLLLRMMQIEIGNGEKEAGYFDLVQDRVFNNSLESWRIPYGLGNLHFRKNNFDQAIIYLKKAQRPEPTHPVILDLMIQAYCRLKLPDEAIGLIKLQITRKNLTLRKILKYTDFLYENNKFDLLLDSQEEGNKYDFMFSIAKAKSLINKNQFKDAENCLVEIEKKKRLSPGDLPVIAQYYLNCESPKSAIRIMEKFLSQKEDLSQSNIIESASIYYQLNDYDKALHLINISNKRNANKSFIKADILVQLKENDLAGEAFNEAICLMEETEIPVINFDGFEIFIPENWKRDIPGQYISATLLKIKDGQITDAFNLAKKSAAQFPMNQSLEELTLKLAHILGDKMYVEEYIEKKPGSYNNSEEEIVIKAENALENNEEVKAVELITDFNNAYKGNNHLAVIQARLLNRNGNRQEAQSVYLTLLNQMQSESLPHEISSINEIDRLISYLAVSETAYELDDLTTAIDICRNLIYIFGLTNRLARLFLRILTRMFERNRLFKKLLVKNHNYRIIEDDIDIFEEIVKSEKLDHLDHKEWIDRSQAVLYEENTYHEEVIKLSPTEQNVGAIIFSF